MMDILKTYQTPEILVFPVNCADLLTESIGDNDAEWSWGDGIIC